MGWRLSPSRTIEEIINHHRLLWLWHMHTSNLMHPGLSSRIISIMGPTAHTGEWWVFSKLQVHPWQQCRYPCSSLGWSPKSLWVSQESDEPSAGSSSSPDSSTSVPGVCPNVTDRLTVEWWTLSVCLYFTAGLIEEWGTFCGLPLHLSTEVPIPVWGETQWDFTFGPGALWGRPELGLTMSVEPDRSLCHRAQVNLNCLGHLVGPKNLWLLGTSLGLESVHATFQPSLGCSRATQSLESSRSSFFWHLSIMATSHQLWSNCSKVLGHAAKVLPKDTTPSPQGQTFCPFIGDSILRTFCKLLFLSL